MLGLIPPRSSDSLDLGRLWHRLLEIGPSLFGDRSVQVPDEFLTAAGSLSTAKAAKEWRQAQVAEAIVLTPSVAETIGRMLDGFQSNSASWDIYEGITRREVSIRWEREGVDARGTVGESRIGLKCRPDALDDGWRLIDFKTTRDADILGRFQYAVRDYGYGLSAALYEEGCEKAELANGPMVFVVTSTVSPYETQVLTLPETYLKECRAKLDSLLSELAIRDFHGMWTPRGYGEIHELAMRSFSSTRPESVE